VARAQLPAAAGRIAVPSHAPPASTAPSPLACRSNALTGTLPAEWSQMAIMNQLWLFSNKLSGPLPASWSSWDQIRDLSLNNNGLSGQIPKEWGDLGSSLTTLYLGNNTGLSGCLPSGLARFAGNPETCDGTKLTCRVC
jgi:hypothetical protein